MVRNEQVNEKFPVGMIILLVYIIWGAVSSLRGMFKDVTPDMLGASVMGGTGAMIMGLITVSVLAIIAYGIIKRSAWARKLGIGWYILYIFLAVFNIISILGNESMFNKMFQDMHAINPSITASVFKTTLIMGLGLAFIPCLIVINYLMRKKDFFIN